MQYPCDQRHRYGYDAHEWSLVVLASGGPYISVTGSDLARAFTIGLITVLVLIGWMYWMGRRYERRQIRSGRWTAEGPPQPSEDEQKESS